MYEEYLDQEQQAWLEKIFENDDLEKLYYDTREEEKANRKALETAQEKYKGIVNAENANQFIESFRAKNNIDNKDINLDDTLNYAKSKIKSKEQNNIHPKRLNMTGRDDKT